MRRHPRGQRGPVLQHGPVIHRPPHRLHLVLVHVDVVALQVFEDLHHVVAAIGDVLGPRAARYRLEDVDVIVGAEVLKPRELLGVEVEVGEQVGVQGRQARA